MEKIIKILKSWKFVFFVAIAALFALYIVINRPNYRSSYIFDTVKRGSVQEVVSESGVISPDGNTKIYSPTNGSIQEIYIKNGDNVRANQKLFKVTSSATQEEKELARTNYLNAKATLQADEATLHALRASMFGAWETYFNMFTSSKYQNTDGSPNMSNRILPEFTVVQNNWLAAEATFINQESIITKDKAALSAANIKYLSTKTATILSPLDGIIDNISVSPGNTVEIKDPLLDSAKPVLSIKNSNNLEAIISVGQTNIAKIMPGQTIKIKPDAYKDKTYDGRIIRIDSIGSNIDGVVTYKVYAEIDRDEYLRAGMTFDSDTTTKSLKDVLAVPNTSIVQEKGIKSVRILDGKTIKHIPITVGVKGDTSTEILSGLSEGQEIIVSLTNEKATRPGFLGL